MTEKIMTPEEIVVKYQYGEEGLKRYHTTKFALSEELSILADLIRSQFEAREKKWRKENENKKIEFAIGKLEEATEFVGTGICDEAVEDMIKELKQARAAMERRRIEKMYEPYIPCPKCGAKTIPKSWLSVRPPRCGNCGFQIEDDGIKFSLNSKNNPYNKGKLECTHSTKRELKP